MNFFSKIKTFNTILNIVIASIVITGNILGQNRNMVFSKFSKEQGLSNLFINEILQDKQGFLWIGTWNGLFRYDGYQFKVYKPVESDPATISNGILHFTKDNNERIWIISPTGLTMFDKKKERFKCVYTNDSLISDYFTSLLLDSKGILWLGTHSEGIWTLNINNKTDFYKTKPNFKRFEHDNNNPNSVSSNLIYGAFEDKQSNIWINASNKIVDLYNPQTGNFEHYPINIPNIENQATRVIMDLEDSEGLYWFSTFNAGIFSWNKKHNVFKQYLHEEGKNSISVNVISNIRQAEDGIFWISTDGGGVSLYNKKTGLFDYCKNEITNPNSVSSNGIDLTFEDKSGVFWIGTLNLGLNKYEADKTKFGLHISNPFDENSLNNKSVTSIIEDKDGNFWIGTDGGGLNFWDKKTQKFKHFLNNPNNPNSISGNAVVCLAEDFEENIWIGTYAHGLNCYNKKEDKFIRFAHKTNDKYSLSHNNIWALLVDKKNNLWVGSLEGTLNLFDRKTNRFYQYKNDPNDTNSFVERYLTNLFEDSRHYLWIATSGELEMVKLDDYDFNNPFPKLKFNHYRHNKNKSSLSSSNVYCIFEDHEGNMWFGTDGEGLNKLNIKTNQFSVFSAKDGLPDKSIKAILEDNDYYLWVSTTNGISKFNPKTKSFRNYDYTDGLQDYYFSNAHCKSADGKLLFGGPNGFNIIDPRSLTTNRIPPKVVLTDFKVYNHSVAVGQEIDGNIILKKSINETDTLILSYKVNFFSFEFTALDFKNPDKNKYTYKLDGFDNQWHSTDAKNRIATYTNLDAGKYTFRVKASNNDGVWNEKGISLQIVILPPWWKTWWFRAIVLLAIIVSVFTFYWVRLALYRKRQQELLILVRQRTQELEKSNELLLERQTQIEKQAAELQNKTEILQETNELLNDNQVKIEEQAEELRIHSDNLKEANDLLLENQKLIQKQSEKLAENNEQLSLLNATKDKFFSIIGHDLRNPFNVTIGSSEMLLKSFDRLPPEKIRKFLELIYNASKNGNTLLDNLLQWSRTQTSRISYLPSKLKLLTVFEQAIALLESDALRKNITLEKMIDPDIIVMADENMTKTIFRNLVSNAIKFTHEKGNVTIKAAIDNQFVEITVSDTGVGIPLENIDKLFRIDTTITTKGTLKESGTGLGLILCKEFVEKHDGKIWVESEEGKGSKFKFTLPLA
jgi:signal transduction histidine kinase/ligand-binding sensor domain-containing protein